LGIEETEYTGMVMIYKGTPSWGNDKSKAISIQRERTRIWYLFEEREKILGDEQGLVSWKKISTYFDKKETE